jgi:lysophospholipase L1-like esterase
MSATTKNVYHNLQLIILAVFTTFLIIEVLARLFVWQWATPEQFLRYASYAQLKARYQVARFISDRHLGYVTTPDYNWDGNRHNSLGFRGAEIVLPKPAGVYRIVCLGGSTTYSDGVQDYAQSYPALLETYLRERGLANVDVVNAGVPGYTSLETLINLQTRVLDLEPDLIVVYHGINEVHARLVWPPAAYRGDYSGFLRSPPFFAGPDLLEHSTALRILLVKQGLIEPHSSLTRIVPDADTAYTRLFGRQQSEGTYPAGIFREVPAQTMLATNKPEYFERNLRSIIASARAHDLDVMLMTFAYSPAFPNEVVASPEYQHGLEEGNEVVKRVAAMTGTNLFDLAGLMPTDPIYYTDGVHFTGQGNEVRARLLGDFIHEQGLAGVE